MSSGDRTKEGGEGVRGVWGDVVRGDVERERGEGVRGEMGTVAGGAGHGAVRIEIGRGALTLGGGALSFSEGDLRLGSIVCEIGLNQFGCVRLNWRPD